MCHSGEWLWLIIGSRARNLEIRCTKTEMGKRRFFCDYLHFLQQHTLVKSDALNTHLESVYVSSKIRVCQKPGWSKTFDSLTSWVNPWFQLNTYIHVSDSCQAQPKPQFSWANLALILIYPAGLSVSRNISELSGKICRPTLV